ncbi:MAG TPA: enolase C-terminal domain-like protein [Thermoplasmata archaeon]|nr:enolase C-terminal domain-like protein [Thermoplasmata archaeon]
MSRIRSVRVDPLFDSRGRATVEATVTLESGAHARAGAPSGASTGTHEVRAFPPGGVPEALDTARSRLAPALVGVDAAHQDAVDRTLHEVDGTPNFARIGGNTATAVSVAAASARADEEHLPLWKVLARPGIDRPTYPAIVGNVMNGGVHAIGGPEFQEFIAYAASPDPRRSVAAAIRVHALVGEALHAQLPTIALGRGDEGGWVAPLGNDAALDVLAAACATARDELKVDVHPGLDLAASEFFRDGQYRYRDRTRTTEDQIAYVSELVDRYDLRYVEDPLDEESFDGFASLTRAIGARAVVVGDDIYTTDARRLAKGIEHRSSNAVLVKVNQVGTLTDTFATVDLARSNGLATVTSHRSGEVPEGWLAHVALGTGARALKCGVMGGERVAKLNELLRIRAATDG